MMKKTMMIALITALSLMTAACGTGAADAAADVTPSTEETEESGIKDTEIKTTDMVTESRDASQDTSEPEKEITFTVPPEGSGIDGFLATKLDLDYSGELFPGSGIDIKATDEYLASQGIMLCSFVVTDGVYAGRYFVYTPAGTPSLGCGVWGDGTEETAARLQEELIALITPLYETQASAGGKTSDTFTQQQAGQQQAGQQFAGAGVSQADIDRLCKENGNADSLIVQLDNDSRWYQATASWAGGGLKEISEAEANACMSGSASGTQIPSQEQSGTPSLAVDMLSLVNADREANGVDGLSWSDDLAQIALQRVADIKANYDAWNGGDEAAHAHDGAGNYNILGENAAAGQGSTSAANTAWINSSAHHGNRLCSTDTEYACAYLYVSGSEYGYYWVEVFR